MNKPCLVHAVLRARSLQGSWKGRDEWLKHYPERWQMRAVEDFRQSKSSTMDGFPGRTGRRRVLRSERSAAGAVGELTSD